MSLCWNVQLLRWHEVSVLLQSGCQSAPYSDPAQMTGQCSYEHSSPTETDLNCSAHQLSLSVFLKVL
jgi:hypothetical protein